MRVRDVGIGMGVVNESEGCGEWLMRVRDVGIGMGVVNESEGCGEW